MMFTFSLSPWKVTQFLSKVALCLVLLSLLGQFMVHFLPHFPARTTFANLFNVDAEMNVPTLYSSYSLLLASVLLGTIAYLKHQNRDRYTLHWSVLSFTFLFLSMDEILQIHEKLIEPLKGVSQTTGFIHFGWVIPAFFLVVIGFLAYLKFLAHLPATTRTWMIISACVYVGGALIMEVIDGYYASLYGETNIFYQFLVTLEEMMEMIGMIIFIHTLLSYIVAWFTELNLQIQIAADKFMLAQQQH
ncbi:MAG: hypothetical protein ACM37W_18685 [Actinomycetota bacterium]